MLLDAIPPPPPTFCQRCSTWFSSDARMTRYFIYFQEYFSQNMTPFCLNSYCIEFKCDPIVAYRVLIHKMYPFSTTVYTWLTWVFLCLGTLQNIILIILKFLAKEIYLKSRTKEHTFLIFIPGTSQKIETIWIFFSFHSCVIFTFNILLFFFSLFKICRQRFMVGCLVKDFKMKDILHPSELTSWYKYDYITA